MPSSQIRRSPIAIQDYLDKSPLRRASCFPPSQSFTALFMPNSITKEAVETAAISIGNKVAIVGGSGGAVLSFLHQNMVAISGISLGLLSYLTSVYFQSRRDRREAAARAEDRAEHIRRMEKMRTSPSPLEGEPE